MNGVNENTEAVSIANSVSLVLSTGITLAAVLWPGIDQVMQIAILGFGNALILLGNAVWTRRRVWSRETVVKAVKTAAATGDATIPPPP